MAAATPSPLTTPNPLKKPFYFYVLLAGQQVAPKEPNTKAPQAGYPYFDFAAERSQKVGKNKKINTHFYEIISLKSLNYKKRFIR
ncbi:hypothetical protein [Campylobacter porcelli]|uniref:hypothetical protein n=1 Tax=Campylobacter porcelli TaxID=1660073 RepID=UPI000A33D5E7|nr:hypothetical protein [Campylobacter sp. P0078]